MIILIYGIYSSCAFTSALAILGFFNGFYAVIVIYRKTASEGRGRRIEGSKTEITGRPKIQ